MRHIWDISGTYLENILKTIILDLSLIGLDYQIELQELGPDCFALFQLYFYHPSVDACHQSVINMFVPGSSQLIDSCLWRQIIACH